MRWQEEESLVRGEVAAISYNPRGVGTSVLHRSLHQRLAAASSALEPRSPLRSAAAAAAAALTPVNPVY